MEKLCQHRSFIEGFGVEVAKRLRARRTTEESGASTGAALVLVGKENRIKDWVETTYPKLGKSNGGGRSYSSIGHLAGRESGTKANLGDTALSGKGAIEK